ncbi:MAG: hypothetical protein M2R45_04777 [Verrucomicrobia subdivision 3 bacterium]|nr:hypothetical protein [Limisphaerales bacterium]MCS1417422.1 hypothetical protein [Limisphaerales bacterium]
MSTQLACYRKTRKSWFRQSDCRHAITKFDRSLHLRRSKGQSLSYRTTSKQTKRLHLPTATRLHLGKTYRRPSPRHSGRALLSYTFPQDGEYKIESTLTRDRNEHLERLNVSPIRWNF